MTYAFTHMRDFHLILQAIGIWASGLGFRFWGWNLDLGTGIWASKLGFEPQVWDFGLQDLIWAFWLEFRPRGWDLGLETGI